MKRITALITVLTILFSMSVSVWADDFVPVSVGENKIEAKEAINENYPPSKAIDGASSGQSYFRIDRGTSNVVKIDLGKEYILDHIDVNARYYSECKVYLSTSYSFNVDGGVELEVSDLGSNTKRYTIPTANASGAFRYVLLSCTAGSDRDARIYEITAYTTPENAGGAGAQIFRPEEFSEEIIKISEGKSIVSKTHGSKGFGGTTPLNAIDDSLDTSFQSFPAKAEDIEDVTIDLGKSEKIDYINVKHYCQRSYEVYVANTLNGEDDSIMLLKSEPVLTSTIFTGGHKVYQLQFSMPEEHKFETCRYVRISYGPVVDEPAGTDQDKGIALYDFSIYKSTRDVIYNAAAQKNDALTDGDTVTEVSVANNTVIDLLAPTYIHSYKLYGDTENVTIKGSLFNTSVDDMTAIPEETTNEKYRFIAIVSDSGEAVSLSELEVWAYYTDVVTPWTKDGKKCSVSVTNTSHKDERKYTFSATAFDKYGSVMGVETVTETIASGKTKTVDLEVNGADLAYKVVCTVERDGRLVSAPAIYIDGDEISPVSEVTPYDEAPEKDFETAVDKTDYFDGLKLDVSNTGGIVKSDILTFSVYNSSNELLAQDAIFANGTDNAIFKYRLPGNADAGEYRAVLSATDAMGNSTKLKYPFTKVAPTQEEVDDAIEAFGSVTTAADFATAYDTYYVEKGAISFSDIPEAEALLTSGIGDSFIKMMSARTLWKKNPSETLTEEDIRDCMKAAVVQNALENKSADAPTVLSKYGSLIDNVFDGTQNNTYTAEIFKTGATTDEELIYNMKLAAALSKIKNASSESILQAMKDYTEILDVDFALINSNNVDELLVAKRIKDLIPETNIIPESFKDGLSAEIAQIVQDNAVVTPNPTPAPPSGGGGGGGGGSYTGEKTDVVVKEDYESTPTPAPTEEEETKEVTFGDVADNHWAGSSIKKLAAAGIVSGRGDGSYDPDSQVSRAEFATMLVKAFRLISDPEEKPEFDDCKVSDWFYPYIDAAVSNNIVSGISKTEFAPSANISRQDACVMSYNIMIYKNYLKFFAGKRFTDSDKVPAYATDAVNMLSGSGVISGFTDGSFGPSKLLSRAQAAIIVDKLMTLLGEEA